MVGECCTCVQYAKSEVIEIIQRSHPISKWKLRKIKYATPIILQEFGLSLSNIQNSMSIKDFKIMGVLG